MRSHASRDIEQRRALIADTVISVLARAGSRGLTHRAVDAAAGLPPGSTSYYFRTRESLLIAAAERLAERDLVAANATPGVSRPPHQEGGRTEALATLLAGLVDTQISTHRASTLARYELSLEAARSPGIADALAAIGERLADAAASMLAQAGAADPHAAARAVIAVAAGVVYESTVGGQRAYSREEIVDVLRDVLAARLEV